MSKLKLSFLMTFFWSGLWDPATALSKPTTQAISTQGNGSPLGAEYLIQFTLGLLVVLMAVVALAWVFRRLNRLQSSAGGGLRTLGGLSLGPRERVVLIQVGETQLLLGIAPGQVKALHVLEQPIVAHTKISDIAAQETFSQRLSTALKTVRSQKRQQD